MPAAVFAHVPGKGGIAMTAVMIGGIRKGFAHGSGDQRGGRTAG
jgi:hypothetical protein